MTLMHSWLIRVTWLAGKVFTHKCDAGNLSALIQC